MKFRIASCLFILAVMLVCWAAVSAQDTSITRDQFWNRLTQTAILLRNLTADDDNSAVISQIRVLWDNVEAVRLSSNRVVPVDLGWIRAPLIEGQPADLEALERQVNALLSYHASRDDDRFAASDPSLSTLAEVLRDPRFQYPDFTPTPVQEVQPVEVAQSDALSSVAQFILLAAGVVVLILVIVYFARNLQVQQATIDTAASDDPTTSSDAQMLADDHAQSRDYRTAIRYMYLASLLMLDEKGIIRYDSALTNREHLRHLTNKPQVHDLLRRVINAFEEVWYGYLPIDEAYYQRFRQQVDELYRMAT